MGVSRLTSVRAAGNVMKYAGGPKTHVEQVHEPRAAPDLQPQTAWWAV